MLWVAITALSAAQFSFRLLVAVVEGVSPLGAPAVEVKLRLLPDDGSPLTSTVVRGAPGVLAAIVDGACDTAALEPMLTDALPSS